MQVSSSNISSYYHNSSHILRNNGIIGGGPPRDSRVQDLIWGWSYDGSVDRQGARFFRITVDARQAMNGFIVFCRSLNGKFKLIVFDSVGSVLHHEESQRTRDGSQFETSLYFTRHKMYHLSKPLPDALSEQDIPSLFSTLDSFAECNMPILEGQYLICVYGDNFIGKTFFSLLCVPGLHDSSEVIIHS